MENDQVVGGLGGAMSGAIAGSALGPLGTIGGGIIGSLGGIFGSKKAKAPHVPTGTELGKSAHDYYDQMAPGTSAWERLGTSNPAGGVAEGAMSSQASTSNNNAMISQQRQQMRMTSSIELAKLALEAKKLQNDTQRTANETFKTPGEDSKNKWGAAAPIVNLWNAGTKKVKDFFKVPPNQGVNDKTAEYWSKNQKDPIKKNEVILSDYHTKLQNQDKKKGKAKVDVQLRRK